MQSHILGGWRRDLLDWLLVTAVVAVALACYRNPTIHVDESFHLLAARSINAGEGLPVMGGLTYTRAWGFSYAVAYAQRLFGDSLEAARFPAVLSTLLLVMAVWLFVRFTAGRLAAAMAGLLLGLSLFTLDISHFCRFYSAQALMVFVMTAAAYRAMGSNLRWPLRVIWLLLAAGAAVVACHLQNITVVAIVMLLGWAGLRALAWLISHPRYSPQRKAVTLLTVVAVLAALGGVLVVRGWWSWAWSCYAWRPNWMPSNADGVLFYHHLMLQWYPILWPLFPAAILAAVAFHRGTALFLAYFFGLGLMLMSISSAHAPRYIFYLMPMFFSIWAMAIAPAALALHGRLRGMGTLRCVAARPCAWSLVCWGAIALVLLAASYFSPAYRNTWHVLRTSGPNSPFQWGDYAAALAQADQQQPGVLQVPIVLAAPAAKALYYLPGRHVLLLGTPDIVPRPKDATLKDYIADTAELSQVIAEQPAGLIVVDRDYWRDPRFVSDDMADVIEKLTQRMDIARQTRVYIFHWRHPAKP